MQLAVSNLASVTSLQNGLKKCEAKLSAANVPKHCSSLFRCSLGTACCCSARLRLGEFVVARPTGLEVGLRFRHGLKRAAAGDAAELAIAACDFPRTLNGHPTAGRGYLALERSPVASLITVDIVVVAALRALAVEQLGNAPVSDTRVVPQ